MRLQSRCHLGLRSSEGLLARRVGIGRRPCHVVCSPGLLAYLYDVVAGLPQSERSKREKEMTVSFIT